eukprot:TRINITY_DN1314_c0_g1_i2.p1 TRINITY_DN1314_c0_g1~~TRINITY_DN1314_c0_g1_i2.p1  ORF type:complete len:611 (-),score=161.96 TRINITY_DN1314_c0_g1_i2:40-1872(-)
MGCGASALSLKSLVPSIENVGGLGLPSDPLSGENQELIKKIIENVIGVFTLEYTKAYGLILVEEAQKKAGKKDNYSPAFKLRTRIPDKNRVLRKAEVKVEEGKISKDFVKRGLVLKGDFSLEIHESDEKSKVINKIIPIGFTVNDNANESIKRRITALAEKIGVEFTDLPTPTVYPEHSIELYHERRGSHIFVFGSKEEHKAWVYHLQNAVRLCKVGEDPISDAAIYIAAVNTRESLGRWTYIWAATADEIISDMIYDELDYQVLPSVYQSITGSSMIRKAARTAIEKGVDALVRAAVAPAWKALSETVQNTWKLLRPKLDEAVSKVMELEVGLLKEIKAAVVVDKLLEKEVAHLMKRPFEAMQGPFRKAFVEASNLFDRTVSEQEKILLKNEAEKNNVFNNLDEVIYGVEMWEIYDTLYTLRDPVFGLSDVAPHVSYWDFWEVEAAGRDTITTLLSNAIFTYQSVLEKASDSPAVRGAVLMDIKSDTEIYLAKLLKQCTRKLLKPVINKWINPLREIVAAIGQKIPEEMKHFIHIEQIFERLVEEEIQKLLEQTYIKVVGPSPNQIAHTPSNNTTNTQPANNNSPAPTTTKNNSDQPPAQTAQNSTPAN